MNDIDSIRNRMTRKEFLNNIVNGNLEVEEGIFRCPSDLDLYEDCEVANNCFECWAESIDNIKFKEENMNIKNYIIQIRKMISDIDKVQGNWNGECNCKNCQCNISYNIDDNIKSELCVSNKLTEIRMKPNSIKCPGYKNK